MAFQKIAAHQHRIGQATAVDDSDLRLFISVAETNAEFYDHAFLNLSKVPLDLGRPHDLLFHQNRPPVGSLNDKTHPLFAVAVEGSNTIAVKRRGIRPG